MKIYWKNISNMTLDEKASEALKLSIGYDKENSSISHSGDIWACAIGEKACGLDIESGLRADIDAISKRYFSGEEQEYVNSGGRAAFLKLWTCKEALAKLVWTSVFNTLSAVDLVEDEKLKKRCRFHGREVYLFVKEEFHGMTLALATETPVSEEDIEIIEID